MTWRPTWQTACGALYQPHPSKFPPTDVCQQNSLFQGLLALMPSEARGNLRRKHLSSSPAGTRKTL